MVDLVQLESQVIEDSLELVVQGLDESVHKGSAPPHAVPKSFAKVLNVLGDDLHVLLVLVADRRGTKQLQEQFRDFLYRAGEDGTRDPRDATKVSVPEHAWWAPRNRLVDGPECLDTTVDGRLDIHDIVQISPPSKGLAGKAVRVAHGNVEDEDLAYDLAHTLGLLRRPPGRYSSLHEGAAAALFVHLLHPLVRSCSGGGGCQHRGPACRHGLGRALEGGTDAAKGEAP
mmetsp:Transcript_7815/g.22191  ORF Transcript_7815/g.22191 Transcript_7815/m.22191 type:complete len:229 (-) Transcript_7815:2025-2711(-)